MKVKWGALMVDGRGKIGGQVASKNRSGAYMKNKVTPINPRSQAQILVRSYLAAASSAWGSLDQSLRSAFDSAVNDWTSTNIFGDSVKPTGKNLFSALGINLLSISEAMPTSVPAKVAIPAMGLESATIDISLGTFAITANNEPADFYFVTSATPTLSPGTSFTKGKFRKIFTNYSAIGDTEDMYAFYVARFGVPAVGANISVEVKLIAATGQAGLPETLRVTVQE